MMEGKMHGKKMESAKMHYEQLMEALAALGMGLSEFEEMMEGEKEEGGEYEEGMEEGEESEEMPKGGMDKGRIAVIIAKMKNKAKGE